MVFFCDVVVEVKSSFELFGLLIILVSVSILLLSVVKLLIGIW